MRHGTYEFLEDITIFLGATFFNGIDGYLFFMLFMMVTVGLAKIILKVFAKQNFKYNKLLVFCFIGIILAFIFKIIPFNLSEKFWETWICFIINSIFFIIFNHTKKVLKSKHTQDR